MNTLNTVREVFRDYKKQSEILDCKIEKVNLYKKSNKLEIGIISEQEIDAVEIEEFKQYLSIKFKIDTVTVIIKESKKEPSLKIDIEKEKKTTSTAKKTDSSIIFGKKNIKETVTKIADLDANTLTATIEGKVVAVNDMRELKNGKFLIPFNIFDNSSTITCKIFVQATEAKEVFEEIKSSKALKIQGKVQFDMFAKELAIIANIVVKTTIQEKVRKDNSANKRVELHLHTQMSQMDGVSSATDLIKRAAEWKMPAIAITDHGVVQAFPEANKASKEFGIKVIYGVEAYFIPDEEVPDEPNGYKKIKPYHAIILVQTQEGLLNLYKLISISHLDYFHKRPRILKSLYEKYRKGLILGSACEQGELYRAIVNKKPEEQIEKIAKYYDYLEIQPLGNNRFMLQDGTVGNEKELEDINKQIVELGDRLGKLTVATCDVHFLDPQDEIYRRILMAGQGFSDADNQAPLYLRTTEEMLREFYYLPEEKAYEVVIRNTNKINEMCENVCPISKEKCPPHIEGAEEEIENTCMNRAKELYGEQLPEVVEQRLRKELDSIIKNQFSTLYIIAQRLVKKSNEDGYLVGSRGSVGSSIVAYMLGITEVNALPPHYRCPKCRYSDFTDYGKNNGVDLPDKLCPQCGKKLTKDGMDIPFETFLGFNGDKEPDIDLNFSGEYQTKIHKYAEVIFGKGKTFKAGTVGTIADKTAFGYVKNYFEERHIPTSNAEISRVVSGCIGVKRTTGQHPGGVIVVPHDRDIYEFCPVQHPADDPNSDIITTHFDYHSIDKNLLKLDMLGHDDPTMIRELQDLTGVDPATIPLDDKATMSLFHSTEALGIKPEQINSKIGSFGVPEFGTKFVREMLLETMPTTFEELIRISGLSHGTDVWLNNAQELIHNKVVTLSEAICTRDDIMTYLIKRNLPPSDAFKIMECVRKGKGLTEEQEELMKQYEIPDWYIESCKKIKYMFPKAHAVAYVTMGFKIAWFKVHHPLEYYTAFFTIRADEFDSECMIYGKEKVKRKMKELETQGNNLSAKDKGLYTILEIVLEMYERKIEFLPVDLYKSHGTKFKIEDGKIRPPLTSIPGLGVTAAQNIQKASSEEHGKFMSIEDLQIKSKANKAVIELLSKFGCLKGMNKSNQISLFG